MHDVLPWLEYGWSFDFPVGMYRPLCERLRGAPARLEEALRGAGPAAAAQPQTGKWSAYDHAVHLKTVEELWQVRIRDYLAGAPALTAADMSNQASETARLAGQPLGEVLAGFRAARTSTMAMLDPRRLEDAARTAHHPRLDRPMRLVDLCLFAAEHDDHHLALIHELLRSGR